eukprot:352861-Chlamydomonas_euryale.AAC.12
MRCERKSPLARGGGGQRARLGTRRRNSAVSTAHEGTARRGRGHVGGRLLHTRLPTAPIHMAGHRYRLHATLTAQCAPARCPDRRRGTATGVCLGARRTAQYPPIERATKRMIAPRCAFGSMRRRQRAGTHVKAGPPFVRLRRHALAKSALTDPHARLWVAACASRRVLAGHLRASSCIQRPCLPLCPPRHEGNREWAQSRVGPCSAGTDHLLELCGSESELQRCGSESELQLCGSESELQLCRQSRIFLHFLFWAGDGVRAYMCDERHPSRRPCRVVKMRIF